MQLLGARAGLSPKVYAYVCLIFPPLLKKIKLGLKSFVKALPIEGDFTNHHVGIRLSIEKIKAGVFDGPYNRQLIKD